MVGAAVGTAANTMDRVAALVEARADHRHRYGARSKSARKSIPDQGEIPQITLIAGNVVRRQPRKRCSTRARTRRHGDRPRFDLHHCAWSRDRRSPIDRRDGLRGSGG
ncbi:MAG: hypothetical protein ACLRSW_05905 [Christensenellaceae bacterium]